MGRRIVATLLVLSLLAGTACASDRASRSGAFVAGCSTAAVFAVGAGLAFPAVIVSVGFGALVGGVMAAMD